MSVGFIGLGDMGMPITIDRGFRMIRLAANLSFLFTELPFLQRFEAAARAGFRAVEFVLGGAVLAI
jgi:hypothetical protein